MPAPSCSRTDARCALPQSRRRSCRCRRTPARRRAVRRQGRARRAVGGDESYCGGRSRRRPLRARRRPMPLQCATARRFSPRGIDRGGFCPGRRHAGGRACAVDSSPAKRPPGRPSLAYGLIRIMTCSTPRPLRMYWRGKADLRWSRAEWCPCVKRVDDICEFRAALVRDFTVTILKRNERNFTAAGLDLKGSPGGASGSAAGSSNGAQGAARRSSGASGADRERRRE